MIELFNKVDKSKEKYLSELFEFLRFPSISSRSEHKQDVIDCANWLANSMGRIGIENVQIFQTNGHPIVYGEYIKYKDKPTVLVYGHYDVQPVEPLNLWESEPFEPTIKDGKIFARGASDDKGQLFIHLKAFETIKSETGNFPINVKFIFEGEEESGSDHINEFIRTHSNLLKCDSIVISDTEWYSEDLPSICYALRGISFIEVIVTGPNRDLHSGSYGGAVDNPIQVLSNIISNLKDRYGRITIPGFYESVVDLTPEEREEFRRLPFNEKEFCDSIGIPISYGEIGYSVLERIWGRPTLDVNGIYGGYIGEGAKTIIPSKAVAKISMRLVPNQNFEEIYEKIIKFLREITPPTVNLQVKVLHGGNPVITPIDSIWIKKAKEALKIALNKEPVFIREGGSIPVCETFQNVLTASPVLLGFGLPSDNIHSPNENFSIDNFIGGIKAIIAYSVYLSQ
ncbi:MAG: dipeptidase [Candidatus Kapaibacteriales bacterium]